MRCFYSDYWAFVAISIWTIAQTGVHLWWILAGRAEFACDFNVTDNEDFYFYATFLYGGGNNCTQDPLSVFLGESAFPQSLVYDALADKLEFFYVILDVIWIISSISLFFGTVLKMKEWTAVIFFTPWILTDILYLMLDLYGALCFGMELHELKHEDPTLTVNSPLVIGLSFGRLGIFWLINLANLIMVIKGTYVFYKKKYADESSNKRRNIDSVENRIRSWQSFYGTLETDSKNNFAMRSNENENVCGSFKPENVPSSPAGVQNLAFEHETQPERVTDLKRHLPWSYIPELTATVKKRITIVEPHEMEISI